MKKIKMIVVIISIVMVIVAGYNILDEKSKRDYEKYINDPSTYNELTEIPIPKDSKVSKIDDDHGGFLGDGKAYVEIELTDKGMKTFISETKKSEKWSSHSLSLEVRLILFGGEYDDCDYGSRTDIPGDISNALYYFRDRDVEKYPEEGDIDFKSRDSYNFTVCVLDLDKNKLYICKYDS